MREYSYYLKINETLYVSNDYRTIKDFLIKEMSKYSYLETEKHKKYLDNWEQKGTIAGCIADCIREKFLRYSISKNLYYVDLDKGDSEE
jgi:hypothetical protein